MSSCLLTVFHVIAVVQFYFALYYVANVVELPVVKGLEGIHSYGGPLYRFLTNWGLVAQTLSFSCCLLNDLFGSNEINLKETPVFRKIKDFVHASLGFPLALFVSITFWGLMAWDRELVFPMWMNASYPTWLTHMLHTNTSLFILVEHFASFLVYPSRKTGVTALTTVVVAYIMWAFFLYAMTGTWVYPVMGVLNWPLKIAFLSSLALFTILLYFVGEFLNKLRWSKELALVGGSKKTSKAKSH